jgi:hypothetical protein
LLALPFLQVFYLSINEHITGVVSHAQIEQLHTRKVDLVFTHKYTNLTVPHSQDHDQDEELEAGAIEGKLAAEPEEEGDTELSIEQFLFRSVETMI